VNLAQTDKPGDVYSHVAKMVELKIMKDVKDDSSKNHELAKKLSG
jgi:DNA-directed RNA polymerase